MGLARTQEAWDDPFPAEESRGAGMSLRERARDAAECARAKQARDEAADRERRAERAAQYLQEELRVWLGVTVPLPEIAIDASPMGMWRGYPTAYCRVEGIRFAGNPQQDARGPRVVRECPRCGGEERSWPVQRLVDLDAVLRGDQWPRHVCPEPEAGEPEAEFQEVEPISITATDAFAEEFEPVPVELPPGERFLTALRSLLAEYERRLGALEESQGF